MRLFVGLDVSLEKTAICVISEHGKIVREVQAASEPEVLIRWMGDLDGTIAVIGLEAGPLSQWLHRGLTQAAGFTKSRTAITSSPGHAFR